MKRIRKKNGIFCKNSRKYEFLLIVRRKKIKKYNGPDSY